MGQKDGQLSFTFTYRAIIALLPRFSGGVGVKVSVAGAKIASESIREVDVYGVGRWREPEDRRDTREGGVRRGTGRGWFLREMFRS